MGFWDDDRKPEPLVWGDQFADVIDDALWQIRAAYLHYLGRPATKAEIRAGLGFSTSILDGLPEYPEDAPEVSPADLALIEENYYAATSGRGHGWVEAQRKVTEVMDRIGAPFQAKPEFTGGDSDPDGPVLTVVNFTPDADVREWGEDDGDERDPFATTDRDFEEAE